jgi:8-oxo-dGTP pyrophosphatase MutT (NUDIX family)
MDAEAPPWRTTASRSLLRDRWIDLRADTLLTGTGQVIEPWYVLDYPDWSVVVALTQDDRLVLVRQWRHAAQRWSLELPGGVVDASDPDPTAAARRELLEETGHGAHEWRYLTASHPNPAIQTNLLHVSLAFGAHRIAAAQPEPAEEIETILMPVDEALAALPHGLFGQSMHVGALLLGLQAAGRIAFTRPEESTP